MDTGEIFVQVALLAYVLSQFTDALVKPFIAAINMALRSFTADGQEAHTVRMQALTLLIDLWPLYATTGVGVLVAQYTELTLSPVFPNPAVGRLLTDLAIGLGPSFVHDLKPKGEPSTI